MLSSISGDPRDVKKKIVTILEFSWGMLRKEEEERLIFKIGSREFDI